MVQTQDELSEKAWIHFHNFGRWERGKDLTTLDEEHREMIKKFLTSFVFREKMAEEFTVAKR